uniref:Multifunctional fusion protein n=1 Tax=Gracilaria vermiculophylla TaxID=2608709 RepID=A0A345U8Z0_9FLOR|nr:translation elongation factor Ts [Gracilaria vermiculophylla]AXI96926.1 translation elongation factor Ts [Gracilaria vermiculophylla]QXU75131.1 translation elongation factor Ts [Gracilaria vermiculophylla]WDZ67957.1 translation elongation factor Ts [Gracilaria vermiculophylla]
MKIQISSHFVKELRSKTGAGMMDCKKALQLADGDMELAIETLRKKGLASANKKSTRIASEGIIDSYIHTGSKIGVLIELNCETDFVARRTEFQHLTKNLAMQIAACQNVFYVSTNDIPQKIIDRETRIESEKEDILNKPTNIKDQIINARVDKRLKEMSLMSQPFIKDQNILIEDLIKQHIALLGENIKVSRFQRFILGET